MVDLGSAGFILPTDECAKGIFKEYANFYRFVHACGVHTLLLQWNMCIFGSWV